MQMWVFRCLCILAVEMFDDERHYNLIWTGAFIKFSKQNTLEILALAGADLVLNLTTGLYLQEK